MTLNIFKQESFFECSNSIELLKCKQCNNFETLNLIYLKNHFKIGCTVEENLYKCESCIFQTYSILLFLKHLMTIQCTRNENVRSEIAKRCRKSDDNADCSMVERLKCKITSILKREILPRKIDWFVCEQCPYRSKRLSDVKRHTSTTKHNHCGRVHKCEFCPYKTSRKCYLKKHVESKHDNTKYVTCKLCPFETKSERRLINHNSSKHAKSVKFQIFECLLCPYKSKTKFCLKQHMDYTHGERGKFKCDYCPFEIKTKQNLKSHILQKHTNPDSTKWFYCLNCSYKTQIKTYLQKHITRHR